MQEKTVHNQRGRSRVNEVMMLKCGRLTLDA